MTGWDGVLCCMLVCQSVCVLICQWSRPSLGHWSYQAQCLATRATSTGATIGSRLVSLTASQVMWMNLSLSAGPIRAGHKIHQPMGTADWWGSACMAVLADRRAVRQLSASVCSEEHDFFQSRKYSNKLHTFTNPGPAFSRCCHNFQSSDIGEI